MRPPVYALRADAMLHRILYQWLHEKGWNTQRTKFSGYINLHHQTIFKARVLDGEIGPPTISSSSPERHRVRWG